MTERSFDKELKGAVHEVCLAMASWSVPGAEEIKLSQGFRLALSKMLYASEKRSRRKVIRMRLAACIAVLILAASLVFALSPSVWAAIRGWFVYRTAPDRLVYEFEHVENDHAFLVVRPDPLPDGFELSELDEGDGYSNQVYTNDSIGEFLNFSYHWATVGDLKNLEKLEKKYGQISIFMGQQSVAYSENGTSMLAWYDKYSKISYLAESNMSLEALIGVFAESIEMHPPLYEPTWLPEGYTVHDIYIDKGGSDVIYYNAEQQQFIVISSGDQGETERAVVKGEGQSERLIINGCEATVYWGDDMYSGTALIMINETSHIVFTIDVDVIDPGTVVKIAEGLQRVDYYSRFMP